MVDICDAMMEFSRGDVIEGRAGTKFVVTNRVWNIDDECGWFDLEVLDDSEAMLNEVRIPASRISEAELID